MGKLYKIDGTVTEITPKDPKRGFTLEECYGYIRCNLIDAKCLGEDENGVETWFICDDEGLLKDSPIYNLRATKRARDISGLKWKLFGNVIICSGEEFK